MGVPPEEFGIERSARSIADCNYLFHEVVTKTEADLIDEGFDADQVKAITEFTGLSDIETIERDTVFEHQAITGSLGINPAARIVKITEHYVRMDYDGDGRPQLYQVITGGDQGMIMRKDGKECIEKWNRIPFAAATPVPQPHRFFGRSIADLIMEVQRIKTAMKRGLLDNVYMRLNPRMEIAESYASVNTIDDAIVARPNGIIRTKQPGGVTWQEVPDVTSSVYPALQYMDAELETKTGLAKQTQGIDANALQNQSATAVAQVFSASQMRIKLVARILGEGVKDIFALLHATIREHGEQQQTVRLRNRWVNIDPRNWKTRDDMTINVGLGTGGKAQQFAQTMALGNVQKELLMGGKTNLVDDSGLYNLAAELSRIMGHKNPNKFFNDPQERDPKTGQLLHPPQPPPPDPKLQIEAMKAQTEQQATQQKALLEKQKADNDSQHQVVKTQAEIELAKIKADLDAKIALLEAGLKERADEREHALAQQKMAHAQVEHEHRVQQMTVQAATGIQKHQMDMESGAAKHKQSSDQSAQQHQHTMQDKAEERKARKASEKPEEAETIEFVHDKQGRIAQIKKGGKTMIVHRNPAGRMERIQ